MCILPGKAISEMTYILSGGKLNPTHSHLMFTCTLQHYFFSSACTIFNFLIKVCLLLTFVT